MNETCRVCGTAFANEAPAAPQPKPTDSDAAAVGRAPRRKHWNPRWVFFGAAIFALVFIGGEKLIEHMIVANDPALTELIEAQLQKQAAGPGDGQEQVSEIDKQRLRAALLNNRTLVVAGMLLFLLTPLGVGALVGFFTGAIRNGAVACGIGTIAVMFLSTNEVLLGLIFGLVYAGLGALGALAGKRLRLGRSGQTGTA
jgi:hypothetical protein